MRYNIFVENSLISDVPRPRKGEQTRRPYTFSLDPELYQETKLVADKWSNTMSSFAERAIRWHLKDLAEGRIERLQMPADDPT